MQDVVKDMMKIMKDPKTNKYFSQIQYPKIEKTVEFEGDDLKMILIDLNQVMISNMMAQLGGKGSDISEDLVRHMILNSIRGYNVKFKEEFIDIIICCDSRHY